MCADVNIHDTDGHNPHSHILFTIRPLDEQGKWQEKTQKEYLCKRGKEECGFTADEFKVAKTQGWEKQYMYQYDGKKEYMTPSEAEKLIDCVRTSKTPKSTRYGRQNPIVELWNGEEQLATWRKSWEMIINEEQERKGILERVDCRSHVSRGLDEKPTVHEGYHARKLESEGSVSERCELNRQIRADNRLLRELKKQVQKLMAAIKENISSIAAVLESLRNHMVLIQYQLIVNTSQKEAVIERKDFLSEILEEYNSVKIELKSKIAEKKKLAIEQKKCGIHFIRASKLEEQIVTLMEDIEELKYRKNQLLVQLNCKESNISSKKQDLKVLDNFLEKLNQQSISLEEQKETDKSKFLEIRDGIVFENKDAVMQEREVIRLKDKNKLVQKLYAVYKDKYSPETLGNANRQIDKELQEKAIVEKKRSVSEKLKETKQETLRPKKHKKECER